MAKRNHVSIKVDKDYFEKFFEPARINLSNKLGINFSQQKFTAYIQRSGAKLKFPKPKNTFAPKKKYRGGLDFRFSL